jgi:hypothetical protein
MTTNEFIKMLREADPEGNGHIRMEGGIPVAAIEKEGYWDGPYAYINDKGEYVYSAEGYKVDVYCEDVHGFVENKYSRDSKWEDIEKLFKFELACYCNDEQRNERKGRILKQAREAFDSNKEINDRLFENAKQKMIENSRKGWTWFQNKKVDTERGMHVYYTWEIFDENGKSQGSNIYMTESVQLSGLWEKLDNNIKPGFYQWILKNN